ncbi:MAG: deoxyribodipyrimidine photolyase [Desulfobulbaceae bacterium BRH_c16a]|nr:MAG: deoxyribodipyrimidine photolyase [Desulfobulbaceae bacterium BRH_c16a]
MDRRNIDIDRRGRQVASGKRGLGSVVYLMSREQRVDDNWALLWAQQEAIIREKALLVVFCLVADYPGANLRHYLFMLKGLAELPARLAEINIGFKLLEGSPVDVLPGFLQRCDAHLLVCDFDPLRIKRKWQEQLKAAISVPFYEVDGHNVIPAWITSGKKEYGAYTIRPKIKRLVDQYLTDIPALQRHPVEIETDNLKIAEDHLAEKISDRIAGAVDWLQPGEKAGQEAMRDFVDNRLITYSAQRNNPCLKGQSGLSPYLHFGQLAPQRLAWQVSRSGLAPAILGDFLEELIVRRELADNFCLYEPAYDRFAGFPEWAQKTLQAHRQDPRDALYSLEQFEAAQTHEGLWNACQRDLVIHGKLHGYLRMYWAKKILEWTIEPEEALEYAIILNDRYSLDGRDANGYTGIAWSIGGVHDRAWRERPVFGKIRYMNEAGCRRKFDVDCYIRSVRLS